MVRSSAANLPAETAASPATSAPSFEAAVAELERIIQRMEEGELPLEESIAAYRRGSELLRQCQKQLGDAERQIQVLENGELRDYTPPEGEAR